MRCLQTQDQASEDGLDALTALESRTNYGRPNWEKIFADVRDTHVATSMDPNLWLLSLQPTNHVCCCLLLSCVSMTEVGMFFCGPRVLGKELREKCMNLSAKHKADGAKFVFNKENF
jgi:hypothetical protein